MSVVDGFIIPSVWRGPGHSKERQAWDLGVGGTFLPKPLWGSPFPEGQSHSHYTNAWFTGPLAVPS